VPPHAHIQRLKDRIAKFETTDAGKLAAENEALKAALDLAAQHIAKTGNTVQDAIVKALGPTSGPNGMRSEHAGDLTHDAALIAKSLYDPAMAELGDVIKNAKKPSGQIGVFEHGGNPHPAVKSMARGASTENAHDLTEKLRANKANGVSPEDISKQKVR
jgi:hypothetical protein